MEGEQEDREADRMTAGREVWRKGEGCGELGIWGVEGGRRIGRQRETDWKTEGREVWMFGKSVEN